MGRKTRRAVVSRLLLVLTLAAACVSGPARPQMPSLWGELRPGADPVGYRDAAGISIWYPASQGGEPIRYRDYFESLDEAEKALHDRKLSDTAIVEMFDTLMYARRDAVEVSDQRPLVCIEQARRQTAADHAVLAEFLASHGYIVASLPASVPTAKLKAHFSAGQLASAEWLHGIEFSPSAATRLLELLNRHRTR